MKRVTFTHESLTRIRIHLNGAYRMARICALMGPWYTRDQIVEAIDALRRYENTYEALRFVNQVLAYQAMDIPMVNGRPYDSPSLARRYYVPQF